MKFRRWLLAPILAQGHHIMAAIDDLKAADARIHDVVSAAKAAIVSLGQQNSALKADKTALEAQVSDLTAKLAAATDETAVASVAADINKAADDLNAAVTAP